MAIGWTTALMMILAATSFAANTPEPAPRFAIYRAKIVDEHFVADAFGERTAEWMRRNINQSYLAQNATPFGEPVLTDSDIEEYCWNRQWIRLNDDAASRLWATSKTAEALAGQPYLVFVDGAKCYGGMIWSMVSSQSPPPVPIIIDLPLRDVLMTNVNGDLLNTADDTRFSERVGQVMGELGKLTTDCAEDWWK